MMRRRVVALVLLLVVAGTPEAFAICQVICVSSSSHGDIASHEHSGAASHHAQAPASDRSVTIQATRHEGCHRNQVTPPTTPTPQRTGSIAIATTAAIF